MTESYSVDNPNFKSMKNQFATYAVTKELKELGFNEPCLSWYRDNLHVLGIGCPDICIKAPLWQQVIDWLYTQRIAISIEYMQHSDLFHYRINDNRNRSVYSKAHYVSRNNCVHHAIISAIEILKLKTNQHVKEKESS